MNFPWFGFFPRSSGQLGLGKETRAVRQAASEPDITRLHKVRFAPKPTPPRRSGPWPRGARHAEALHPGHPPHLPPPAGPESWRLPAQAPPPLPLASSAQEWTSSFASNPSAG